MAVPTAVKTVDVLGTTLSRIRRRQVCGRLLEGLSLGLLVALSGFAAWLLAERLLALPGRWPSILAIALGAAAMAGLWALLRALRFSSFDAAVLADDRLQLKERLSSALWLQGHPDPLRDPAWGALILRDGEAAIARTDIARMFPVRPPRSARWIAIPAALSILFAFLPPLDLLGVQGAQATREELRKEVERKKDELSKLLEELRKEAKKPPDPEIQKALDALQKKPDALTDLAKKDAEPPPGAVDAKREALVQFSRLEDALKKSLDAERFDRLREFLDRFPPGTMARSPMTGALREALKAGDFQKAGSEMKNLQDILKRLSEKSRGGELSKEEVDRLKRLSEELERLAKDSSLLAKLSKGLQGVGKDLGAGDLSKGLEGLQGLEMELQDLERLAEDLKFLQDATELVRLSAEDLANLHRCPDCGKITQSPGGT